MAIDLSGSVRAIALAIPSVLLAVEGHAARSDLTVKNGSNIIHTDVTTAPFVLDLNGSAATVQFAITPLCVGLACGVDGPAVSAALSAANLDGSADATARYTFTVLGGPDPVPILLSGLYSVFNPPEFPDGSGGTTASASVSIKDGLGADAFVFQSVCYNYTYFLNESSPPKNCGASTFAGSFLASAGSTFSVVLHAFAGRTSPDAVPGPVTAYIDPFFEIDPNWRTSHSGYALQFEPGVGNGAPGDILTAVPEPETVALMAAGLAALMVRRRTRPRPV